MRALCAVAAVVSACADERPFPDPDELQALRNLHSMAALPPADPTNRFAGDKAAAALGARLFADPLLSRCGTVSCASCHAGEGLTLPRALAEGCDGRSTLRNPPTILNSGHPGWMMWDGRADRLWSQAILPLTNPLEMDSSAAILRARLEEVYSKEYEELMGKTPLSTSDDDELLASFGKIVAAHQRLQNRTVAPFDAAVKRFIAAAEAGEAQSDEAFVGLRAFVRKGQCIACHKGPTLSDDAFHNLGVADLGEGARGAAQALALTLDWRFNAQGPHSDAPAGAAANRLASIGAELSADPAAFEGAFRTPSLRNASLTAPYMHTGALASLEEVVDFYDRGGDEEGTFVGTRAETIRPLELSAEEKSALVRLLQSLAGASP